VLPLCVECAEKTLILTLNHADINAEKNAEKTLKEVATPSLRADILRQNIATSEAISKIVTSHYFFCKTAFSLTS